jgi:hypothetical protein
LYIALSPLFHERKKKRKKRKEKKKERTREVLAVEEPTLILCQHIPQT